MEIILSDDGGGGSGDRLPRTSALSCAPGDGGCGPSIGRPSRVFPISASPENDSPGSRPATLDVGGGECGGKVGDGQAGAAATAAAGRVEMVGEASVTAEEAPQTAPAGDEAEGGERCGCDTGAGAGVRGEVVLLP